MGSLHYYKCNDCLSPMTTIEQMDLHNSLCFCGGHLTYLGEVTHEERVVEVKHKALCDARCTHASGPVCNCHCNCENHGKGILATITIEKDHGKAILTPINIEEALSIASEYRTAVANATQRMETYLASLSTAKSHWARWNRYDAEKKLRQASHWKRHALRMQRLNELVFE